MVISEVSTLDGTLSKQDAVALVSLLTTPYLALPLVVEFVSQERMVGALFHPRMQVSGASFPGAPFAVHCCRGQRGVWTVTRHPPVCVHVCMPVCHPRP